MTNEEALNQQYFEWLCTFVGCYDRRRLLAFLHSMPFEYTIILDGNRYEDGQDLRYRFANERGIHYRYVTAWIDNRDCSVLEMMVALSIRIEEHIMGDPGDPSYSRWFCDMLKSMGIYWMTDDKFNETLAQRAVYRMMRHEYARNGEGGLFTLSRSRKDMRKVEIWYQAMWYLDELLHIK
jgi:hypothetical protein